MASTSIDLNADLGEGFGALLPAEDDALLDLVTSASVACGFHAGDPVLMGRTVAAAAKRGVAIGAHPGYPDLMGFGRRELAATTDEVTAYVIYQVGALAAWCHAEGTRLRYVKAHGALYNRAVRDPAIAGAIADGVRRCDPNLVLLGLAGSELVTAGLNAGLRVAREGFADRGYRADGTLISRGEAGALLTTPTAAADQALRLAPAVDSICVHGDTPGAVTLLRAARERLLGEGYSLAPFAP